MNLITLNQLEQNGIQDANGNDSGAMSNRVRTLYIPIQDSIQYKVISTSPIVVRYLHFYNSNKVWISAISRNSSGALIFQPPIGAAFIRIAFQRSNANDTITPAQAAQEGKITLTWDLEGESENVVNNATEIGINHNGQLITGNLFEGNNIAGIRNKGMVYSNEIIEY